MTLRSDWLNSNPEFSLNIPIKPRYISPHPYTNRDIIGLARGPLVYCLEDVDNPWVDDHFKSLVLDPTCSINESAGLEGEMREPYVALTAHNAAYFLGTHENQGPHLPVGSIDEEKRANVQNLSFIPYALRDNRGGKGHMRVGIRRKRYSL